MQKINVGGIGLAYERRGHGAPLVLLHGYPLDHTVWEEVVPLLEADFDLILPDLRGFGQSETVEGDYGMPEFAADTAGLLDHLGIVKAYIAGHSMGGYVALAFVRAYPIRVLGLGLISSQAVDDTPERKQGRYASATEILQMGAGPVAESMSPKLTADERVQAFIRRLIAQQRPAGLAGALKAMAERPDSTSALPGFNFPLVIIHGEADALIPVERAREVKMAVPQARLIEIPRGGHMPMMEAAQTTARALSHFL